MAARMLARWLRSGAFPNRLLESVADRRPEVQELVFAAVRRRETLDWILRTHLKDRPAPPLRALLHIGLVQLFFMDRMPDHAAVHETVEAARELGLGWAVRLVNAVLRRAQRNRSEILLRLRRMPPSVRLSHPPLLVERWERELGALRAHRLCEWNNQPARVCVRLRPGAPPVEHYVAQLRERGCTAEPHPYAPDRFVELGHGIRPASLPLFQEGLIYLQDPSTTVAPELLAPQPGETVLDACAAPGGKTALLAERMNGRGRLIALELHEDRLDRLRENLQRLHLERVEIVRADAATWTPGPDQPAQFDAILLDAPCTNTGVIRRRPDARWTFSPERLERLCRLQAALLDALAPRVRGGGRLVYSTCSLEPEENNRQIVAFLGRRPDFVLVAERLLVPTDTATDGAYAALLVRRG
ncbi:MAG: 16S rRNA (cytosine(967)-C(5))-methyltransferase RsmB [Kiritimatiellae bacterium]|nr:16S rRNA (cytosine(967)-C(5))-methyltransferase RsmB [Kiritimatiellia bacterium]